MCVSYLQGTEFEQRNAFYELGYDNSYAMFLTNYSESFVLYSIKLIIITFLILILILSLSLVR
mgnify:CR=1 FL=1